MGLLIWDRVREKHKDSALSARDLTDFKGRLDDAVRQNASVAADAQQSLLDRVRLNMRVDNLETEVRRFDEVRDMVISMKASNTAEHQATQASIAALQRGVEGVQAQIRLATAGGANAALTITRTPGLTE